MSLKFLLLCTFFFVPIDVNGQTTKGIEGGFPEAWNGDSFRRHVCKSSNIPIWLEGYFLIQTCAAYGKQSDPLGKKLVHMFDGIGAVASLEIWNGYVGFSAQYYPTRHSKIWNFYDRDMAKTGIGWQGGWSPYNVTSVNAWNHIRNENSFPSHPNVDFWKIGKTVLGATEFVGVGMQFNVSTLTNFAAYPFKDNDMFYQYRASMIPLGMPVHERVEKDGSLYASVAAFDPTKSKMFQVIFKVTPDGTRTTEGIYEYATYDASKCREDGSYSGDKKNLAGYMHSITSTKKYIILPLTSVIYNPCRLGPMAGKLKPKAELPADIKENVMADEFATDVPLRFLVFDKVQKRFLTEKPIEMGPAIFITHQFNAYEDDDGTIVADMMGSEEGTAYDMLIVDNMLNRGFSKYKMYRYKIDLKTKSVQRTNILSDNDTISAEFSSYNRDYMEMKYKFGYIIEYPFMAGSKIAKIDLDQRKIVAEFSAPGSKGSVSVFREPWFVAKPGSKDEDDGVILTIAGDITTNWTTLYILDAKSLTLVGEAEIPTFVPFGFHNRFFSGKELE